MCLQGVAGKARANSRFKVYFTVKISPIIKGIRPLTVVVGKNTLKKATGRNLMKRRVRSILLPISKKTKISFRVIVRPAAAKLTFAEIKKDVLSQL